MDTMTQTDKVGTDKVGGSSLPEATPLSRFIRERAAHLASSEGEFGAFAAGALIQLAEDIECLGAKTPSEFQARAEVMPDVLRDALWTIEMMQGDINRALATDDVFVLARTPQATQTMARLKAAIERGMPIYSPSPCDDPLCEVNHATSDSVDF